MKPIDVTTSVMQKVVGFEKKRSLRFAGAFLLVILVLILLFFISVYLFAQSIVETEVADLFSLYFQDWEAVQQLWRDAIELMWDVVPHWIVYGGLGVLFCFVLFFLITRKKRTIVARRIHGVKEYEKIHRS